MALVVSGTSPLNYRIQIKREFLLPLLYGTVLIPRAVQLELENERTPQSVRLWMDNQHPLIKVVKLGDLEEPSLAHLDPGEREAILLAERKSADLLLMDERAGVAPA